MMDTPNKSQLDFMCQEYENFPALIAHWDSHFWNKSQWFFAAESVLLGAVGYAFKDAFLSGIAPARPAFIFLVAACVFNFWICYVWFRTNRSNREYLGTLLPRARAIEEAILGDKTGTFSTQRESLHQRHSSSRWEIHLPSGFALAWVLALITAARFCRFYFCWALITLALSLIALLLIERFHPKRHS